LTDECSVVIQNKLPAKLKDPERFSIPCVKGNVPIDPALCDLGSSVSFMPLSTCEKLDLGEMRPTSISLQLADCSVKYLIGILEDVPTEAGDLYVPADPLEHLMLNNSIIKDDTAKVAKCAKLLETSP